MEAAIRARISQPIAVAHPRVTIAGLRHALGDCVLAGSFILAAIPAGRELGMSLTGAANAVWLAGAAIMAVMSLARFAPQSASVNVRTVVASGAMLMLPCLMRPGGAAGGALSTVGLVFELIGVGLSQVARLYMGRSFGVLPANRGIVSKGPFRWVRHPIYSGWLGLSIGYAMCHPSARNIGLIAVTLPFMVWRIDQEEAHLSADPEYRRYMGRVRYRLVPAIV